MKFDNEQRIARKKRSCVMRQYVIWIQFGVKVKVGRLERERGKRTHTRWFLPSPAVLFFYFFALFLCLFFVFFLFCGNTNSRRRQISVVGDDGRGCVEAFRLFPFSSPPGPPSLPYRVKLVMSRNCTSLNSESAEIDARSRG